MFEENEKKVLEEKEKKRKEEEEAFKKASALSAQNVSSPIKGSPMKTNNGEENLSPYKEK